MAFASSTSAGGDFVGYHYDDALLLAAPDQLELDDVKFEELC